MAQRTTGDFPMYEPIGTRVSWRRDVRVEEIYLSAYLAQCCELFTKTLCSLPEIWPWQYLFWVLLPCHRTRIIFLNAEYHRVNTELSLDSKNDSVFWVSNEDIGIVFYWNICDWYLQNCRQNLALEDRRVKTLSVSLHYATNHLDRMPALTLRTP